ncbi:MAG: hypothetical protein ACR2MA_06840 [Egibacteraceae bacterium]
MGETLPADETRLPHGYTNATDRVREMVHKSYRGPDSQVRRAVEYAALSGLHGQFPVPKPLSWKPEELYAAEVIGRHGQEVLDDPLPERAATVLRTCGRLRRQLSEIEPATVPGLPGTAGVVVHGDFGP